MTLRRKSLSLVLLSMLLCVSRSEAVTIDDFTIAPLTNPLIAVLGTPVSDFQTGLPGSNVLGGSRLITVIPDLPNDNLKARVEGLPAADPARFRFTSGFLGASLELEYDFPTPQDFTLGGAGSVPALIRVGAVEMTAGSQLSVSLVDGSGSASSHQIITRDYSGATPTYYDYYIDAEAFPGSPSPIDFTDIDVVALDLASVLQVDDLASFSIEPVATGSVDWANSVVLQPAGNQPDLQPMRIGFQSQTAPFASPVLDLSDPTAPKLHLSNQTSMDYRFFLAILYPPDDIMPHRTLDPSGTLIGSEYTFGMIGDGGESFRITLEFDSDHGYPPDEVKWRGFNPQPEPPAMFTDQFGFDFSFGDIPQGGAAAAGASGDDVTVTIRIQSVQDFSYLSFTQVPSVPTVSPILLIGLGMALATTGARAAR